MLWWLALSIVVLLLLLLLWKSLRPQHYIGNLDSRAVLITGCDSGFGWHLCHRLDKLGVAVFAGCLKPEGEGAHHLAQVCSARVRVLPLDVTSDEQVAAAYNIVCHSLAGRELWAVVNNAGVVEVGEIELTPLSSFERALAVNTMGMLRVTKAFLPLLRASQGRIITVASPLGRTSFPIFSPYCISKSATIALCDALRVEMKKWSISVHTVEPTAYKTDINNTELYKSKLMKNFEQCDPSVRESYGEDYAIQCGKQIEFLNQFSKPASSIGEVVEDMLTACIGRTPGIKLIPGFKEKILYNILPRLPTQTKDKIIYRLLQSNLTLPKRKTKS